MTLPQFQAIAATRCSCGECRTLDRAHPFEGFQLRLLSSAQLDGEPGCDPARPSHPDAPAVAPAGVSETQRPPKSRHALAASTDRSTPDMTDKPKNGKPQEAKKSPKPAPDAPATAAIVPTAIETVALGRLKRAPENVRHTDIDEDTEQLADDIAAHGLLQSLIGYRGEQDDPDRQVVYVAGGGRRLQALGILAERGAIDLHFPVPVLIRDREDSIELSLSENLARRDMNPADEFVAFATLMAPGTRSPADLAKRFGFSERYVRQRLKLAGLIPEILDALRGGELTLEAALAYGRAADQDVQRKVFKAQSKRSYDRHGTDRIRYAVDSENKTTDWPLYRFIGAEAYDRAGGGYEDAGLFGDDTAAARRIADGASVIRIAGEHIDFQMLRRMPEMADELELDREQVVGFEIMPDIEIGIYTMAYHGIDKRAADGFVWVGNDFGRDRVERMLKTIRNNRIAVKLPVGIDQSGELVRFPKGFFVPKEQRNAIDPPAAAAPQARTITPEEAEAQRRQDAIERLAYRRGIGLLAGTPLEGRAQFPTGSWINAFDRPEDPERRGKGQLVTIQVFVTNEQMEAELAAAEADYDQQLLDEAERKAQFERERIEREKAAERREAELREIDPPAIVMIDGDAWARDANGGYSVIGQEEDSFLDSWGELLDFHDVDDIGETYADRAAYEAATGGAIADDVTADNRELEEQAA